MLSPKIKLIVFKLLLHIFAPDYRIVYRQYIEARIAQQQMKHLLRAITSNELQKIKLQQIAEQMSDLEKSIYTLNSKGIPNEEIARKLNIPLNKIEKHLDVIERELYRISQYSQ